MVDCCCVCCSCHFGVGGGRVGGGGCSGGGYLSFLLISNYHQVTGTSTRGVRHQGRKMQFSS